MEAGLGGGSGDAAAVLKALNEHFDHPFSEEALFALALQLGADIPFALKGGLARVTGIGETHTHLHMRRSFSFIGLFWRWMAPPCVPMAATTYSRQRKSIFPSSRIFRISYTKAAPCMPR